ncbi:hypothetical protein ACWD25_23200 [Streptomyces sp. NPDC002920]
MRDEQFWFPGTGPAAVACHQSPNQLAQLSSMRVRRRLVPRVGQINVLSPIS